MSLWNFVIHNIRTPILPSFTGKKNRCLDFYFTHLEIRNFYVILPQINKENYMYVNR
jgi:hypothetical protein